MRTVDTDVIIILAGKLHVLLEHHPGSDIWVAFGTGKHFKYVHINSVCSTLGKEKCIALPAFHSFTGCDTTSGFFGRGKKLAWEAWKSFPGVTEAFLYMARNPHAPLTVECEHFKLLERFCVVV